MNELIATGQYGRLFAVVHFASHQWKVTSEDLILIENELDIECGERIRLEKVRRSVSLWTRGLRQQMCYPRFAGRCWGGGLTSEVTTGSASDGTGRRGRAQAGRGGGGQSRFPRNPPHTPSKFTPYPESVSELL